MSALEWMLTLVFIVPMVIASVVFVLCAMWMQVQENHQSGEKHGLA